MENLKEGSHKVEEQKNALKEVKRTKRLWEVRLTEEECIQLETRWKMTGLSKSKFVREAVLKGQIVQSLSEDERRAIRTLSGIGGNLNQLVKKLNSGALGKVIFSRGKIDEVLKEIRESLQYLKNK